MELIIGIAVTIVISAVSWLLPKRQPSYKAVVQHSYTPLINDPYGELLKTGVRITLENRQLRRVGRTVLRIWNRGSCSLLYEAVKKPIVISFGDDARIVVAKVRRTSRKENPTGIRAVRLSEKKYEIKFTHLDRNDGALIYILHESRHRRPLIGGTIVGQEVPFEDLGEIEYHRKRTPAESLSFWISLVPSATLIVAGVAFALSPLYGVSGGGTVLACFGLSYTIVSLLKTGRRRTNFPKSLEIADKTMAAISQPS